MLSNNRVQQKVAHGTMAGLLIGIGVWIGLTWQASLVLRSATRDATHQVMAGPLKLMTLHKDFIGTDYTASMSLEGGFIWFLLASALAGALVWLSVYAVTTYRR